MAEASPTAIRYRFDTVPADGKAIDVAPGIKWLRMPLPLALDHINLYLLANGDGWLVVDRSCVLVQRTTAKEQDRRLIAAELSQAFIDAHGGVVVENHLNMVRTIGAAKVSPAAVAAVLNSDIVDQVFRCISGSVAVSAFELESIPLPPASAMATIEKLVAKGASRGTVEKSLRALYGVKA